MRLPGRCRPHVAMPAELDAEQPIVPDLGERGDNRPKSNIPLAKLEVFVNASPHIFQMDIGQPGGRLQDFGRNWHFAQAMQVANIKCYAQGTLLDTLGR